MTKNSFLCGILSAILIPVGALASDTSTSPPSDDNYCRPMLKIEKIAPPFVKNGDKVEFKIFVRNLSRCKVNDLTVKDFLPEEFRITKKKDASDRSIELEKDKDHKFTVIKWRDISIKPKDFVVIKFEATARIKDEHDGRKTVRNTACVFKKKDRHDDNGDDYSDNYGMYSDYDYEHGEEVGQALCSSVAVEIVPRPYHAAPAPAPVAILNQ